MWETSEDIQEQTLSPTSTPTPNKIYYTIEDYIDYFQKVCACICDKCEMNKKENFNYLLTFLDYIEKNKDYVKDDNQLCYLISSILPLTLYLCKGSSINEINDYTKKKNQCLDICYKNEDDKKSLEGFGEIKCSEYLDFVDYCY
jgi:hypothetical protein